MIDQPITVDMVTHLICEPEYNAMIDGRTGMNVQTTAINALGLLWIEQQRWNMQRKRIY